MFKVGERPFYLIICLLDVLKNDFVLVDEAMFKSDVSHVNSFLASWASKNATWKNSRNLSS
jgi:hypothetical protein